MTRGTDNALAQGPMPTRAAGHGTRAESCLWNGPRRGGTLARARRGRGRA